MRRALAAALALAVAGQADAGARIVAAEYAEPTTRHAHGVLGDDVEWGALRLTVMDSAGATRAILLRLPRRRVFEDIAPRVVTLAGRDAPLAMVVESDAGLGARLALYDAAGLVAATPFIGQAHRWLAPVGAADLDGDGRTEIAYVDRPHLARILRIWRFEDGRLREIASAAGFSNHRIGEAFISGGLRDCGEGPEIVTADAEWKRVLVARLRNGRIERRDSGALDSPARINAVMACRARLDP
ncbi:VCBS repeat-containing protein [Jhaorihella thermophila]|uniref:Repeat domain-containing protein n=1 Tax=Jhaorihella thermophila TaxID=488547 RepID=A0A1H5W791_9RHOB|nr:VCBS repeat-containing protein [Jhaorihella thermophila]SEF95051.1 hypothetical protein SAMN05421751_107136 [Jhaorihella thermophila]